MLITCCSLCIFIICAHIAESKLIIVRDYDDEPVFLSHEDRSTAEHNRPYNLNTATYDKPKKPRHKKHTKHAVIHYGRHTYHLDSYDDLDKLRTKLTNINKNKIDLKDIVYSLIYKKVPTKDLDYVTRSSKRCQGKICGKDFRRFGNIYMKESEWKFKKMPLGRMKRFRIINNENNRKQKKHKHKNRNKNKNLKNKWSNTKKSTKSNDDNEWGDDKPLFESEERMPETGLSSESEDSEEKSRKHKKKHYSDSSESEKQKHKHKKKKYDSGSNENNDESSSIENTNKKKNRKKRNKKSKHGYDESEDDQRKTMSIDEDVILQGNKIYHAENKDMRSTMVKNETESEKRRRLQHFLPKRYHWDEDEIHNLGYYWFNGPKGKYPAPKNLLF